MTTITSATSMSNPQRRPRRAGSARHPAHVLLNVTAVNGEHLNRTTAKSTTRHGVPIQVSFLFKRPPQASTLFVSCSYLNFDSDPPEIICSVDNLLLLRVNVSRFQYGDMSPADCDYFVYRADPKKPSLELLQPPHPFFPISNVALLPRSDGHYTVAALVSSNLSESVYELHRYHSGTPSGWSIITVSAPGAWKPLPADTPRKCYQMIMSPNITTVITIGGERGTVGWVDLWRGILLCDVLDPNPAIRGVPLPLPLKDFRANNGFGKILGYAGFRRGISFVRDTGCLKLVHMDVSSVRLPRDEETGTRSFHVDDWSLTMWSNKEMSDSLDDWHEESSVEASKIMIDNPAISQALDDSGLHIEPRMEGSEQRQQGLQNLAIYQPIPCDSGKDIVYLMARKKFMHPTVWMLALEMNNGGRLQGVACCGTQEHRCANPTYCLSRISRYLYPKKKNPATIQVKRATSAEESDEVGGLELIAME